MTKDWNLKTEFIILWDFIRRIVTTFKKKVFSQLKVKIIGILISNDIVDPIKT